MSVNITRPIIGIENRTAQEVFDIMVARIEATPAPHSISVVVKQLDWQRYEARSVAGCYRVQRLDDKWEPLHDGYYMLPKQAGVVAAFDNIDEAKAYAQKDFEARIRAALASTEGTEG